MYSTNKNSVNAKHQHVKIVIMSILAFSLKQRCADVKPHRAASMALDACSCLPHWTGLKS